MNPDKSMVNYAVTKTISDLEIPDIVPSLLKIYLMSSRSNRYYDITSFSYRMADTALDGIKNNNAKF